MYLRLPVEEEACTTQEILDRHAGKALQRVKTQKRRRRWERKEERTDTGWREAGCTERESQEGEEERKALQDKVEEQLQRKSTEEGDRSVPPRLQGGTG